jgi:hypothetical protein
VCDKSEKFNNVNLPDSIDAHHMVPQDLRGDFKKAGIHIDDPE